MPWHDNSLTFVGPSVVDLAQHFIERYIVDPVIQRAIAESDMHADGTLSRVSSTRWVS